MKRTVMAALVGVLTLSTAAEVSAAPKKKKDAKAQEAPQSAEIAKAMGDLKWGMTRDEVIDYFTGQIRERYKQLWPRPAAPSRKTKLRARQRDELNKMKSSLSSSTARRPVPTSRSSRASSPTTTASRCSL